MAYHVCTVCFAPAAAHPADCPACDDFHFPPLCCPGCDCRSFEAAHAIDNALSGEFHDDTPCCPYEEP